MIDVTLLREDPDKVKKVIATKNADPALVDAFVTLDVKWREVAAQLDGLRARQNELSKARSVDAARENKEKIRQKEQEAAGLEKERDEVWAQIPNLPSADTPVGPDENANQVLRTWGEPTKFDFKPKDHLELGQELGIIDTETAGRVAGTRFGYLKGAAVAVQFALIQFGLEVLQNEKILSSVAEKVDPEYSAKKFLPVVPPVMIRPDVYRKMARLDAKTEEERYYMPRDDAYLIGSAEHTLGPMHMDKIFRGDELPVRYAGYSTSFRREAGSYGKDTRGIFRVHQFDKLEIESFTAPEDSLREQEFFVAIQEYLMQELHLPYRVVICSTGDQGDPDARHIDLETWMPGDGRYRETHSADCVTDYQARRLGTKLRRPDGKTEFVHMNDATVFAIGRTLIAILENNQTADGKVRVPEVLVKYGAPEVIE